MEQRWMDYIEVRGVQEEVRRLGLLVSRLSDDEKEFLEAIIGDFYKLERDRQRLTALENEASLLEDIFTEMWASESISPEQFVRENTPHLANLFEIQGSYSNLSYMQRLMESPENTYLKQRLQALHVEFKKIASLLPHVPETTNHSMMAFCLDPSKWLDANMLDRNPEAVEFLRTLNISSLGQASSANDLSFMFLRPTLQGSSSSCTAHAVASDMEFEINKANQDQVDIDEEYTYLKLQNHPDVEPHYHWQNPIPPQAKGQLSGGHWNDSYGLPDRGTYGVPLNYLGMFGFTDGSYGSPRIYRAIDGVLANIRPEDHQGERQEVIDRLKAKPRYAVKTYASYSNRDNRPYPDSIYYGEDGLYNESGIEERLSDWRNRNSWEKIDCSFIRLLIDHQQPPMVILSSNARKLSSEDWLHIPPMGTRISHVAVIVGYGQRIDPRDMVEKPYFILRDSFVDQPMHYKVAADELLPIISELHKITKVEHVNPIPEDPSLLEQVLSHVSLNSGQ